ncbi:hypothetical protein JOM56_012807 [Amanita muscaria]
MPGQRLPLLRSTRPVSVSKILQLRLALSESGLSTASPLLSNANCPVSKLSQIQWGGQNSVYRHNFRNGVGKLRGNYLQYGKKLWLKGGSTAPLNAFKIGGLFDAAIFPQLWLI